MDSLILAINSKYIHSSLAPWYLKSEISDLNVSCTVLEHTVNEPLEAILEDVLSYSPKLLAISVYIWNLGYAYEIAQRIKSAAPKTIIVFGGPEVSYNSKEVLSASLYVDFVICGEGEIPFRSLCQSIILKKQAKLYGVSYRNNNEIIAAEPYIGSGTPRSPYTDEYFAALNKRIAYFESSRGCPYSCAYCLSGRCEGMRFFDMDYVKENIIKLAKSGSKTIKFVDRTFNANKARAIEILTFIMESSGKLFDGDVCFHFELSGDLIDDGMMSLLCKAPHGLFQFEIGIQSFNETTIKAICRKTDSEVLKYRIKQLSKAGNAHIHTDLIAGLPYENYQSFIESFNMAHELGANMLQLGFLKILHGTELCRRAEEYGFLYSKQPPYEVYETPWLSRDEFLKLKLAENAVDKLYNSGRFKRTVKLCLPHFINAYDFFFKCGQAIKESKTLDSLTDCLYSFLCSCFSGMADEIRDALVCDRLASNSSKGLPKSLYRSDTRITEVKKRLNGAAFTAEKQGVRRNIALLYHCGKAVYADYDKKDKHGEYMLHYIDI